jgi:HD-like signal output (HDOD) protein
MPVPLTKLLDDVVQLCPLPATTKKVMELADSDRASIANIARVISTDPALATAVLRVANSALYAGMKVAQLEAAVIRIGLRELKSLASAMSVLAAFRSKDPVQAMLNERCVLSGTIANKVAKVTKAIEPSLASTCGLLSEIGAMACLAGDTKEYSKLWQQTDKNYAERVAKERERYSVSSFEIGRQFLERNSVPDEVSNAVGVELGVDMDKLTRLQALVLTARHSAAILLTNDINDEAVIVANLDELAKTVEFAQMDGKSLYELFLREGVLRDLTRR